MSSILSTGDAPAQRVPAWKRLGLKLKPASEEQGQNATLPHNNTHNTNTVAPPLPNHRRENPTSPANANPKRKSSGVPALDHSAKRAKRDSSHNQNHIPSTQTPTPKKAKSVSFATEANQTVESPASVNGTQIKNKQNKQPTKKAVATTSNSTAASTKPAKKQAPVNLEPALAYLRQWHTSKDTWKFNKNHQTRLLEQVFADEKTIPAADIHIFYEYIRGLKGAVRTRLKELASGIKAQDAEQGPIEGFPASSKEMAERKQKEYHELIAAFLSQTRTPGKRRFEEVDYVLRTSDMEMQRRVVKRMRCENVLDELSDSETETASMTTTITTSTQNGSSGRATSVDAADEAEGVHRLQLNDGSQQRVKRRRKLRTAAVEEDSSSSESESDSDSDSDTSSSGSDSSSEESEDEAQAALQENGADSSSSSSSSSESESESDSDDE
ncbi:uncharacterized protein F4822DRAFT_218064 [Hypoxylon trugodes]|uniref:uncharacterized protein n=1 Tax=Hypoxylon trugodes TaxID=326681 RepID=UPI002195474D|nr:uncharacterized protein F4822DRAFT_218064 [Hypoxylon trugodes]KAI1389910.1 hypothetical protein F4822DRAFT_218064 [Hypoxylon trugodes]